jgi:hypothetical protein
MGSLRGYGREGAVWLKALHDDGVPVSSASSLCRGYYVFISRQCFKWSRALPGCR